MNRINVLSVILLATTTQFPVMADNELDPVIVTATRTAQTADTSLAPVTVITQQQIEHSGATDLVDLLSGHAGIYFSSNGGTGKSQSIYLRGTNSDGILVLINGVRVGSATNGQPALAHYPLQQIEHIEIVRGPRSALYGSGAIGGVIQIFTKQPSSKPLTTTSVGIGNHGSRQVSLDHSNTINSIQFRLSAAHNSTDGISAKRNQSGASADDDGYRNNSFSGSLNAPLSEEMNASLNWLYADGHNQYDGSTSTAGTRDDTLQQVINAKLDHQASEIWDYSLGLGYSEDFSDTYSSSSASKDTYNTRRHSLSWQNNLLIDNEALLTVGADYINDKISATTNYGTTERDEKALFGQYQFSQSNNDWIIALRHLNNESFGGHNSGNIDFGRNLNENLRFIASYGEAFHAPDMNDLYYPLDVWGYQGNPNLVPEESKSVELGLKGETDTFLWSLQGYQTKVNNLIVWSTSPSNVGQAQMRGLEFEGNTKLNEWRLQPSLSWLDAKDLDTNKWLPRRARWSYRFDAERDYGLYTAGVTLHGQSHSYNEAANTNRLGGFGLVDTRISYRMSNDVTLNASIKNLLDQFNTTATGYNGRDRELLITLQHSF